MLMDRSRARSKKASAFACRKAIATPAAGRAANAASSRHRVDALSRASARADPADAERARRVARICDEGACTNLSIAGDNLAIFAERIGFADTDKSTRLDAALLNYRRKLNRERFTATVATVEDDGDRRRLRRHRCRRPRVRCERPLRPQLWRTAAAVLRLLRPRQHRSHALRARSVHARRALRLRRLRGDGRASACACSTTCSTSPCGRCRSSARRRWTSAASAWASPAWATR